jgi:hypothetical protein
MARTHYIELDHGMVLTTDTPEIWPEAKHLGPTEGKRKRREYAKAQLLAELSPGNTVYTVLRHVSKSGMMRHIDLYVFRDNEPRYLTVFAADALEWPTAPKDRGLKVNGCGMDMGFHAVNTLSYVLFKDGNALNHRWL